MKLSNKLCFLVALAFHYSSAQATNYCDPTLCFGYSGLHVGCNSTGQFASTCSSNARMVTMTERFRTTIVEAHNEYRNKIAKGLGNLEPAARMATMQWDDELAYLAELRSLTCTSRHDKCRGTGNYHYAGQNVVVTTHSFSLLTSVTATLILKLKSQMDSWYDQYTYATVDRMRNYTNVTPLIGSFAALAQEKATRVGCAMLQHHNAAGNAQEITTCNYSYINVKGRPVYTPGTGGSQCVTGTNSDYRYLCSVNEVYAVNEVPGHNGITTKVNIE